MRIRIFIVVGLLFSILGFSSSSQAKGEFAIVIDDLAAYGYGFQERILPMIVLNEREVPISYAVMPNLPKTRAVGQELDSRSIDYLIHFPMEASTVRRKPGEARFAINMPGKEISELLIDAIDELPNAVGLNNHQGSLCTSDYSWMETFLKEMDRFGLNFLDSGTVRGFDRCRTEDGRQVMASVLCKEKGICPRIEVLSQNLWLDNNVDYNKASEFRWIPSKSNPKTPDIKMTCDAFKEFKPLDLLKVESAINEGCSRSTNSEEIVVAIGHPKWATICGLRRFFYSEKNRQECPITSIGDLF